MGGGVLTMGAIIGWVALVGAMPIVGLEMT
jgi:hypothetical protein